MITLVLGGMRSGKSEIAEQLARGDVTVIATAARPCDDAEFAARIDAHQARRPHAWRTVEEPFDVPGAIATATGTVLVDALGTWIANARDFQVDTAALCAALQSHRSDVIVVSDEVGLSVHPPTDAGRHFADALGDCNRAVAAVADRVLLVVAGRVIEMGHP